MSSEHELRELYVQKGLSARQIAKEKTSSKSAVLEALHRFNIPIRQAHLPHGRQSQVRYGQKKLNGKVQSHIKEGEVIAIIRQLRDEGMTLRMIADVLTKMKIPTKNRGRRWHPEMIRRILENTQ